MPGERVRGGAADALSTIAAIFSAARMNTQRSAKKPSTAPTVTTTKATVSQSRSDSSISLDYLSASQS